MKPNPQRYIQGLSLGGFLALLFFMPFFIKVKFPVDIFLRLSPLAAITTNIAARAFILSTLISLLVVIATFLFGRFFCAYVCPMGTTIDALDFAFLRGIKRKEILKYKALRSFKYYVLAFLLVSSIFGLLLVHFFDPISLATRIYTFLLYPFGVFAINLFLDAIRPLATRLGWISMSHAYYIQPLYSMNLIMLIFLAGIISLSLFQPRFWCRNVCPLGAFLGLLSRYGIFKRVVDTNRCTHCGVCDRECPMGAIEDNTKTIARECTQCRTCVLVCPKEAVSFKAAISSPKGYERNLNVSRRMFLSSVGLGATFSFLSVSNPRVNLKEGRLIRPPGAIPEDEFLDRCIRCGECMRVCVTNTLQPALLESGFEGLWTPHALMRIASCERTCNLCGKVCPTQAIRNLDLQEKNHAKMGTAVIYRQKCLAWEYNRVCIICDEQCPYDAIELITIDGIGRPFVLEDKCTGCGQCENKCPILGEGAIVVTSAGEIRLKEGSYIEEMEKLKVKPEERSIQPVLKEEKLPAGFVEEGSAEEEELPPGFIAD